eukprot:TRINITY_DN36946_c0_g1_i1.p1 TRINITY_DN36946_c0_g1~~TRINITY_DN36946_c0_g1_i1.p1  ORF type:complete len:254 (+),score=66.97 TRINITY_DN36946_c0_g1_i1:34-795(+)
MSDVRAVVQEIVEYVRGDDRFQTLTFDFKGCRVVYKARVGTKVDWGRADTAVKKEVEENTLPQKIWPASFPMAEWLAGEGGKEVEGKVVAELGSGVGLVGMVAALKADKVVMSDLAPASVALCSLSLELEGNESIKDKCKVTKLKWGTPSDHETALDLAQAPFNCVIGADVFYFRASLKAGLATASALLSKGGIFYCASAVRSDQMEDALHEVAPSDEWDLLEEPAKLVCSAEHEGQVHKDFEGVLLFRWMRK